MYKYHVVESWKRQNALYRGEYISRDEVLRQAVVDTDRLAQMEAKARERGSDFYSGFIADLKVTWQEDIDVFFPPETSEREAVLQAENELLAAEVRELRERVAQLEHRNNFWFEMFSNRFSKKDVTK